VTCIFRIRNLNQHKANDWTLCFLQYNLHYNQKGTKCSFILYVLCELYLPNWFLFCLGIVLKNVTMTKKGKSKSNVGNGVVIDTLVIFSSDLVQVVAKVR
jgi:hypothetical protein